MQQTRKMGRWLSMLLTAAMLLAMLPTAALGAEEPGTPTEGLVFTAETEDVTKPGYSWGP